MNFLKPLYLAGAAIGLLPMLSSTAAERPNVLLITVDDLKPLIGAYGNTDIPTPNFDRLAKRGTVMTNAYCQQAICAPSRMSMYTGLRPDSTRVWDLNTHIQNANPEAVTMQQWFRQAGYTSEGAGKVMHGARANHPESWSTPFVVPEKLPYNKDFPVPAGVNRAYQGELAHEVFNELEAKKITDWRERFQYMADKGAQASVEALDVPDDAYIDGAVTVWAEGRLQAYAKSKESFFLSVGYIKPHLPFVAPKKYWDMFKRDEIKLAEFQQHAVDSPLFAYHKFGELRSYSDISKDWDAPIDEAKQRELIHGYYACVAYIDAQIGKLLDTLDSTGLAGNTIIVLWGDHGYHLGDHGLWNKHSNFEQATRVPLMISVPGLPANQKTEAMAEMVDVFPTLVELAGLDAPYKLEGTSLVPVLKNATASVKEFSISQYPRGDGRMGYALRTPRYRLVMWMRNEWRTTMPYDKASLEAVELYDYEKDPLETVNLANNPAYATVKKELTDKMLEYFALYAKLPEQAAADSTGAAGEFINVQRIDYSQMGMRFTTVQRTDKGLKVSFEESNRWPSIEFIAPDDNLWNIEGAKQVDITLTNNSAHSAKIFGWVANPGDSQESQKRNSANVDVSAGQTVTLRIPISASQYPLDLKRIKTVRIFTGMMKGPLDITLHSIKAEDTVVGQHSGSAANIRGGQTAAPRPAAVATTQAPAAASAAVASAPAATVGAGDLIDLKNPASYRTLLRFAAVAPSAQGVVLDFEHSPRWPSVEFVPVGKSAWNLAGNAAVEFTVKNLGERKERVFIYLASSPDGPQRKTRASGRVDILPGETKTIRLNLAAGDGFTPENVEGFRIFTGMHEGPVKMELLRVHVVR